MLFKVNILTYLQDWIDSVVCKYSVIVKLRIKCACNSERELCHEQWERASGKHRDICACLLTAGFTLHRRSLGRRVIEPEKLNKGLTYIEMQWIRESLTYFLLYFTYDAPFPPPVFYREG